MKCSAVIRFVFLLVVISVLVKVPKFSFAGARNEPDLKEVFPEGERFEAVNQNGETYYYKCFDRNNKLVGAVFKTKGDGYAGVIETLAGMKSDGTITAIKVLSQTDTPGRGSRVVEDSFTSQFRGKDVASIDSVQAVTGATISSSTVINSVKNKAAKIKELLLHNV